MDKPERKRDSAEDEHWTSQGELSGLGSFGPPYAPGWIENDPETSLGVSAHGDWREGFRGGFGNSGFMSEGAYGGRPSDVGPEVVREARVDERADGRLYEELCSRLRGNRGIDARSIQLRCDRGAVTIDGFVPDGQSRRLVEDIVNSTPGVREVDNRLRIDEARL